MASETLVVRLPLSSNQIYAEELPDLTSRDAFERPHNLGRIKNDHRSSYLKNVSQESILADIKSKLLESRSFAPNVRTADCHTEGSGAREDHPRPSSEDCPNASQNPLQDVTASPMVQSFQLIPSEYADPKRVPGTDQNIYPRAPINPEFHERYPQLVDFFKQAVDSHKVLKYHTSKINYELRLCGSTPSNAVASIVIFCAQAIFKDLQSLLNNKHIQRQYQPKKPSMLDKFRFSPSKPHLQASAPVVAPFKIVFWREAVTPTERRSAMEQVVAKSHSFLTMCGSLVRYGNRTSTMGLLISVDSKLYGLTVDHLFKNQRDEEQPTITNEPDILPDEEDTEASQANWSWVDDVTYENIDSDGGASENGSVTSERSHAEVTTGLELTDHDGDLINGHKVDSLCETDTLTPFLDWALIEFDSGYFERPNAFYSEEDPVHPKFIAGLSAAPKTSGIHVFIISGVSGTRKGLMLNSKSYIGGKPGERLCQVWNVILSDSGRVIDGDCGSLVVDQETLEVYGHVVASNPLGEAYVVPLQDTFNQIAVALGAKDLSLPSPELLMESLVTYYSKAGDSGVADEAKLILGSMAGLSCTSSQPDVEDIVRKELAAFLKQDLNVIEELERSGMVPILVRRLPLDTAEAELHFMLDGSRDFIEAEVLSPEESEDPGFRSAVLRFKSHAGALEGKEILDWNIAARVQMAVEVLDRSPTSSRRYSIDNTSTTDPKSTTLPISPTGPSRITSKLLINTDSVDNDWTDDLKDPVASFIDPPRGRSQSYAMSLISNAALPVSYQINGSQHYKRHISFPPVNPADQNPPCNTLHVGGLPIDVSEEELRMMFSPQGGFKRVCFRRKQNSPICFVEFDDVSFAARALRDLNGQPLPNSIEGGIRLSFSKNPLGVRFGQEISSPEPPKLLDVPQTYTNMYGDEIAGSIVASDLPPPPRPRRLSPRRLSSGYSPPRLRGYSPPTPRRLSPRRLSSGYSPPRLRGYSPPRLRGYSPPTPRRLSPRRLSSGYSPPRLRGYSPPTPRRLSPRRLSSGYSPPRLSSAYSSPRLLYLSTETTLSLSTETTSSLSTETKSPPTGTRNEQIGLLRRYEPYEIS